MNIRLLKRPGLSSLLFVALMVGLLCWTYVPRWDTNDDIAMSMIAHGYGFAAYGSPNLVFSNVLWGYLVRALPAVHGVPGYSIATILVLLTCGWAILYYLIRLGAGWGAGMLMVALLLVLPTLFPQFTYNAGLLSVAGVIGWMKYARLGGTMSLVFACLMVFLGFLVRHEECLLVVLVSLPFFPWKALKEQRSMQLAFLLLGAGIAVAALLDHWSYSGAEWQHFREINSARIPFTDYGADPSLKQHPEIIARHGYTQNDISLLGDWFLVDTRIADPQAMNAMLEELSGSAMNRLSLQSGIDSIKALWDIKLFPLLLACVLVFVLMPNRRVAWAWVLFLVALFVMGILGRPGILRIYVPVLSLLLVATFISGNAIQGVQRWVALFVLAVACAGNFYTIRQYSLIGERRLQQVQEDVRGLPGRDVAIWGGWVFPFEIAYPVLAHDADFRKFRYYGLNAFTYAPFSVASAQQASGLGMLERFRGADGISIIATRGELGMLRMYCAEHMNGQLSGTMTARTSSYSIYQVRCMAG